MCRPVKCATCNKTTWAGCGQHVAQVRAAVPAGQWCTCSRNDTQPARRGFFARLFGR